MTTETTEVATKLTLDDHAHEALHKIKEGFEQLHEKVTEVGHEMMGMAKQAAAVAIGFQLGGAIESVKELGEEIFDSATHLEEQKKSLAGAISMVEKGEMSFGELAGAADEMNEKFEALAIQTGNTKESMLDAFEMIASRSTRSAAEVEEMTGKMAVAAKNLPGGLAAMSAAWRDMETGMMRPKNAIVQLMRQTGVVEGGAKKVAKALNAMLQGDQKEKVFDLAERAIDRMAAKMKDAPLTFDQLMVSLKGTREAFYETMGAPMVAALVPELEHLKAYLQEHREEIEQLAHTMGEKVGQWVKLAAEDIKEGFEYLQDHAQDIEDALKSGAGAMKDAIAFLAEHRDLIMGLAAAQFIGKPMIGAVGAIASAAPGAGAMLGSAIGKGAFGMAAPGALGATAGAGALAAADVIAWQAANEQMGKLEQETGLSFGRLVENWVGGFEQIFKASDRMSNITAIARRIADSATQVDTADESMKHFIDSLERSGEEAVAAGDMTEAAYRKVMEQANAQAETHARLANAMGSFEGAANNVFGAQGMAVGMGMSKITSAFHEATTANAKEADAAARRILTANNTLRVALAGAAGTVEEALKKLHGLADSATGGAEVKLPPINFGPSTFHIHQDFRQQDPDRVATMFERDITRRATNRIASRFSVPFSF